MSVYCGWKYFISNLRNCIAQYFKWLWNNLGGEGLLQVFDRTCLLLYCNFLNKLDRFLARNEHERNDFFVNMGEGCWKRRNPFGTLWMLWTPISQVFRSDLILFWHKPENNKIATPATTKRTCYWFYLTFVRFSCWRGFLLLLCKGEGGAEENRSGSRLVRISS